MDGRPYVAKDVEPYIQYWLSKRYRILLTSFSRRGGCTATEAINLYFRITKVGKTSRELALLRKAITDMEGAGVLISPDDDTSRYDARMADDYLKHRPFPKEISDDILRRSKLKKSGYALDLAGGPGSLAVGLAAQCDNVALMDLSRGFLAAAKKRARQDGLKLTTIHESCNRLLFHNQDYDLITVSQALHWLDDVLVCRGVCQHLREEGSFIVIQSEMTVAEDHPLSFVLGNSSVLGSKAAEPFVTRMDALLRRISLLFEALDAPDASGRYDGRSHIVCAGAGLFRQERPYGSGFARAFLTPQHVAATGQAPASFWATLETRCSNVSPARLQGVMDWAVLHFRRGGPKWDIDRVSSIEPISISGAGLPNA